MNTGTAFLKNTWYVAAWSHEIAADGMFARTITRVPLLLLQAREHVIARFRPILNAHGITEQQWRIVRALIDTGPLEPREIGELCRISSPSLAGVLSRMEELGYIKRKRLDHDQRRVRVSLTALSRKLSAAMEIGRAHV